MGSIHDHMFASNACAEFEYYLNDLASPRRAGYIMVMKTKVMEMADKVGITKPTVSGVEANGTRVKGETTAVPNTREDGQSLVVDNEKIGATESKEGKNNKKNKKKKKKAKTEKADSNAEVEDAGVEFSRMVLDTSRVLHIL